ncbi:secreted RxLR effector protein 161-like [Pistacia vera]|uniref:secreted RxLR effector protein 161-like n=1 Tax=Pistacia vera TaxID=55513 RepID=UPI001263101B|nr:secreted RxLR effector protein 161-like [Pistacia vera]
MATDSKLVRDAGTLFDNPTLFRSIIGGLQYLTLSQPDLAFAVNKLSQFLSNPTEAHWTACKRVLRYIKGTLNYGLVFKRNKEFTIEAYADADWASDVNDRRSTSGYVVFLTGNLVQWSSRKQKVISLSSTKAKYRALSQAATEVVWTQHLFKELGIEVKNVPVIWCDNMSAGALSVNPVFHARTKHIEIDVHYVRELGARKQLNVQYVDSEFQKADVLTKSLPGNRFAMLRTQLNVVCELPK